MTAMRKLFSATAIALLAAAPVFAQTSGPSVQTATEKPAAHNWPKPVDHGPYTAQANEAYQGGGMILQGAPGAPPPRPEPTPPGQTPRNMVPQ
jgi:hypothetical protein